MTKALIKWVVVSKSGDTLKVADEQNARSIARRGDSYGTIIRGEYRQVSRNYAAEWARRKELGTAFCGRDYAAGRVPQSV